jgi:bacillithiol biosynthesis cysteine-adding enzyme BshC
MRLTKVPFQKTKSFSDFFLDYISQKEQLRPFYNRFPSLENFSDQITEKKRNFSEHHRKVLAEALTDQYKGFTLSQTTSKNLDLLKDENTFTVVTGHQLNICTGPLYFIYKIVTVINTCRRLKERYPLYNFIPTFWMASEDHDYEEIKSFRLFGQKYTWNTSQTGAVGRFSTDGLSKLMDTIPQNGNLFKDAYRKKTLSDAVRFYVNELFKEYGLIIIDGDSHALKSLFKNIISEDILNQSTRKLVDDTNSELEKLGYKTQVYCREINFFYLDHHLRSRIEKKDNYDVLDSNIQFDRDTLMETIETKPERFSPNVILRPLYQELILPNLAYVGGPAEMIYWLQLKSLFDHHSVVFPILLPRNFAMVIESHIEKKFLKTGLTIEDLFKEKGELFNQWVLNNSNHNLSVKTELEKVKEIFEQLQDRSEKIDVTLKPFVGAQEKHALKGLERIGHKMLRAEKRKQREKLGQIEAVKDHLFPNGGLQERVDNFLNFYSTDQEFITKLVAHIDPLDFRFNVLHYES